MPSGVHFDVHLVSKYIYGELERILGMEDEVLGDMLINMLFTLPTPAIKSSGYRGKEEKERAKGIQVNKNVDPKEIQLMLNDFIGTQMAYTFMESLWEKLIDGTFIFKESECKKEIKDEKRWSKSTMTSDFRHSDPLSPHSDHARERVNDHHSRQRHSRDNRQRYFDGRSGRERSRSPPLPHQYQRFSPRRSRKQCH